MDWKERKQMLDEEFSEFMDSYEQEMARTQKTKGLMIPGRVTGLTGFMLAELENAKYLVREGAKYGPHPSRIRKKV